MIQEMEWEIVNIKQQNKGAAHHGCVYLSKTSKSTPINIFNVSGDIANELGWEGKTRVNLYRAGSKMFMLSPSNTGLITIRKDGNRLKAISWQLCAELHPDVNGTEFKAWVDGKNLYFKAEE